VPQPILATLVKETRAAFQKPEALAQAREALPHGEYGRLFDEGRVPISQSTAGRYIAIHQARSRLVPNSAHAPNLPPSWMTLYELAQLPEDTLAWAHEQGRITPDLGRRAVKALRDEFAGVSETPEASPDDPAAQAVHPLIPLTEEEAQAELMGIQRAIYQASLRWPRPDLEPLLGSLRSQLDHLVRHAKSVEVTS